MKILYVCHRLPYPPNRGGKIRPFYMIKHLSRSHEVVVASLARSAAELREGQDLAKHCSRFLAERVSAPAAWLRMFARLPTSKPSSMAYFYSRRLAERIREELARERFELIFVHCSSVAQYVEDVHEVPKLIDFGDMDSQKWLAYAALRSFPLSLGYAVEGAKLQEAEKSIARKFDLCTCTTPAEKETLDSFRTGTPSAWFPNGVNADYFKPASAAPDPDLISFIGRMDYYPNEACMLEFCRSVLPLLKARRPGVKLVIVGAHPPSSIRALASLPGVTVTGSVPDVRPYVQKSSVCVAPLRIARGTQNKILESLSMGVPTVASDVAAGGIDAVPGEHLLTASTPEGYVEAILGILEDPVLRRRLAEAGRERMLSHHGWEGSMERLDGLIAECVHQFRSRKERWEAASQVKSGGALVAESSPRSP
jgi:hypothetical protein